MRFRIHKVIELPNQEKDNLTGYGVLDLSRDGAGGEEPENIVQIFIDNISPSTQPIAGENTFNLPVVEGSHQVQAKARYKGVWYESAVVHFPVKKKPENGNGEQPVPQVTVTIVSPTEGQEIQEGTFDFKVKVKTP